jgi:hypothetical protein
MAELRTDFAGLRAELADVRTEIADRLRSQTWPISGLLLAAVGFAVTMVRIA